LAWAPRPSSGKFRSRITPSFLAGGNIVGLRGLGAASPHGKRIAPFGTRPPRKPPSLSRDLFTQIPRRFILSNSYTRSCIDGRPAPRACARAPPLLPPVGPHAMVAHGYAGERIVPAPLRVPKPSLRPGRTVALCGSARPALALLSAGFLPIVVAPSRLIAPVRRATIAVRRPAHIVACLGRDATAPNP